jgi:hypothetical protein
LQRLVSERLARDLIRIPNAVQNRKDRRIRVIGFGPQALLHMRLQILNDLCPALGRHAAQSLLKPSEVLIQNRIRDRIFHVRSPRPTLHRSHP